MTEFTDEMKTWMKQALLNWGVPADFIQDDPRSLVWQVREHTVAKAEGYQWMTEKIEGPSAPVIDVSITQPFTSAELLVLLLEVFQPIPTRGFDITDQVYELTMLEEVERFWVWYQKYWLPMLPPIVEKFDCDDFALVFAGIASATVKWAGLPIGEISGYGGKWGKQGHVWNIFVAKDGGIAKVFFLDTQSKEMEPIASAQDAGLVDIYMVKI